MTPQIDDKILSELEAEGLRIANDNEPGWYWKRHNEDGERVTLWVTDEK